MPTVQRLLPLDEKWRQSITALKWPTKLIPQVVGEAKPTLLALIHAYLFTSLFKACAESLASENASRLAAMQRAEKTLMNCWMSSAINSIACAKAQLTKSCLM